MDGTGFDHLTKGIGDLLTRRGVLRGATLGTIGLGLSLTGSLESSAKKKKKRKSKKKGDPNALCKREAAECASVLGQACGGDEACVALVQLCCPNLNTCNFGAFSACLLVNQP